MKLQILRTSALTETCFIFVPDSTKKQVFFAQVLKLEKCTS